MNIVFKSRTVLKSRGAKESRGKNDEFTRALQDAIVYGTPISPHVITAAMDRRSLDGEDLRAIYDVATEGAACQFSRGFQDQALQYIAIAAHARKALLALGG